MDQDNSNSTSTISKPIAAANFQKEKDSHDIGHSSQSNCQTLTSDIPTRTNEEDPAFISPHLECELAKAQRSFAEHDLCNMEKEDKASDIHNHSSDRPHMIAKEDTNTNLQLESVRNKNMEDVANPIEELSHSPSRDPLDQISLSTTAKNSSSLSMIASQSPLENRENINCDLQLKSAEITNLDDHNDSINLSCSLPAHTPINQSSLSPTAAATDVSSELSAISSQTSLGSKKHTNLNLRPDANLDKTHNLMEGTFPLSSHSPSNEFILPKSPDSSDKSANSTVISFQSATQEGSDVDDLPTIDDHPQNSASSTVISFHSATHDGSDAKVVPTIGHPQNSASSTEISFQSATHEASDVEGITTTEGHPLFDPSNESDTRLQTQPTHKRTLSPGASSPTRIVRSKVDTSKTSRQTDGAEELPLDAKPLLASTALPVYCKLISALEEARKSNCLTDPMEEELNKLSFMCRQTGTAIIQKVPLPPEHNVWVIIDDEDEDLGAKYGFSLQSSHAKGRDSMSPEQSSRTLSTGDNVSQVQLDNKSIKDTDLIETTNGLVDATGFERFGDNRKDDLGGGGEDSPASKISANLNREGEENPANPPDSCQQTDQSSKFTSQFPESTAPDERRWSRSQQMTDLASQVDFEQADVRFDEEASESLPNLNPGEKDFPAEAPDSHQPTNHSQNNTTQSAVFHTSYEPRRTRSKQQTPKSNTPVSHSPDSQQSKDQRQTTASQRKSPPTATHQKDLRSRGARTVDGVLAAANDSNKTLMSPSMAGQKTDEATTPKAGSKKRVGQSEVTTHAVGRKKKKTVEGNDSAVVFDFFIGSAQMEKELTQLLSPYSGNQTSKKAKLSAWDALNSLLERRRVGEPLDQIFTDSIDIDGGTNNVVIRTEFNAQKWFEAINKTMPQLFNSHKGEPAYAAGFFNTLFVKTESLAEEVPQNVPEVWHQTWRSMRMSLRPSPTRVSVFLKVLLDSVLSTGKTFLKNPPRSESEKAMSGVQAVCQAIRWLNSQKTSKGSKSKNVRLLESDNADSLVDIGLIQQWQDIFIKVVDSYVVLYFEVNYILKEDASAEDKAVALKFKKEWKGDSIKAPTLSYLVMFACCGIRGLICCSGDVNVAPAGQMLSFAVLSEWMCKGRPDFKVTEPIFKRSNQTLMKLIDGLFDEDGCFVTPEITWYELAKNLCFDYLSHWFLQAGPLKAGNSLVFPKSSAFSGKDQIIKFPGRS